MAELVDALVSGTSAARRGGSKSSPGHHSTDAEVLAPERRVPPAPPSSSGASGLRATPRRKISPRRIVSRLGLLCSATWRAVNIGSLEMKSQFASGVIGIAALVLICQSANATPAPPSQRAWLDGCERRRWRRLHRRVFCPERLEASRLGPCERLHRDWRRGRHHDGLSGVVPDRRDGVDWAGADLPGSLRAHRRLHHSVHRLVAGRQGLRRTSGVG